MIGFAFCGSFCTLKRALDVLRSLRQAGYDIQPIVSERVYSLDTRFFEARDFRARVEALCGREVLHTVDGCEPLGPRTPLEALVVAPCTGNTLAKCAAGITDSAVTMALKAHLRADRPTLIALASNDAMSHNLKNIAALLTRKSVFFTPLAQDDPLGKPYSLVADFARIPEALTAALEGRQLHPLFL